jgi:hypothetical protein
MTSYMQFRSTLKHTQAYTSIHKHTQAYTGINIISQNKGLGDLQITLNGAFFTLKRSINLLATEFYI